jgi:threonine/homoserine/homoserine lactone efflux protein
VKDFIKKMNEKGIPVPLCRVNGAPSVSFTLVVISSLFVMLSLLNSFAAFFKGVDTQSAIYWAGMCYALYFGRKITGNGKEISISEESKEEEK